MLEFKTPVWLDDIICVTNGTAEEHEGELRDVLSKLQKPGYRASQRKNRIIQEGTNVAEISHQPERGKADQRKNRSHNQAESPNEHKRIEIITGINPTCVEISEQPFYKDRQKESAEERCQMGMDPRNRQRFRATEEGNHRSTMPSTIRPEER